MHRHIRSARVRFGVLPAVLAVALAALTPAAPHAQAKWLTYTNVRFAFAVDYPADLFPGYVESDNSDGATFNAAGEGVGFRAFGFWNNDHQRPRALLKERYEGKTLSYSVVKRDYFVASGKQDGRDGAAIFYDRCNLAGERVICVNLVYPAADKKKWDAIVQRLTRSLRAVGTDRRRADLSRSFAYFASRNSRQAALTLSGVSTSVRWPKPSIRTSLAFGSAFDSATEVVSIGAILSRLP
jgi:hypothetical protein